MNDGLPPILQLRAQIEGEEFDYLALLQSLQEYAHPRDKITTMLRRGDIVRVKKGIYVFGRAYARRPYSLEIQANMIYGPAYVSLDSALQYHGLIPEGVEAVTSMTVNRPRRFTTPAGLFIYRPAAPAAYPLDVDLVEIGGGAFLLATPEKALADRVKDDRGSSLTSVADMERYLLSHLRIYPAGVGSLDPGRLDAIATAYGSRKVRLVAAFVRSLQEAPMEKRAAL